MDSPNPPVATPDRLTVFESHRPPAPVLRFVDQVVGSEDSDLEFRFSRSVLTDFGVDVVHVVEPMLDQLLGTRNAGPLQRWLAVKALTRNLRKHRIALVRTLPGIGARGRLSSVSSLAQRALDKATTTFVVFDESTDTPDPGRTIVIPHAHFGDRFAGYPRAEKVAGRVLCVARDRLPSLARGLIAVPRVAHTPNVSVRFAGGADSELEEAIRAAIVRHSPTVSARLERLSDGARVQEIDKAALVAVPQVSSLAELETVHLALTLDRPVITPRSAMMENLANEMGEGWLHLSDGPITAAAIDEAFTAMKGTKRGDQAPVGSRDLRNTAASYSEVFQNAVARVRGGSRQRA